MERVLGVGGVFFKAQDPALLAAWYREHLGIEIAEGQTFGMLSSQSSGEITVFSTFPADSDYFGNDSTTFMLNFRVRDLEAMLNQLREAGVPVEEKIDEQEYGRFGWVVDPEGNRIELWEPTA